MARVSNVSVTVSLDNGDAVTLNVADPAPGGDNPAFLTSQVHVALDMLERRLHDALESVHGPQQHREARPSDELLAPRELPAREQVVGYPGEQLARARPTAPRYAPHDGAHVRFPDVYGDLVFETANRETGAYVVVKAPAGSDLLEGAVVQVNTDAAYWEPAS